MAKTCDDCVYRRPLSSGEQTLCCHYSIDTGKLRNCPVEECKNKLTLEEVMKKLTSEDKQEIIRLRMEQNVPVKLIAEKFHVSKSAVFNIIAEWKKHGDSAISNDEKEPDTVAPVTDSEQEDVCENIPADIIPENSENVKPEDVLHCAVVDAVANEMDRLYDVLAECDRKIQKIKDARENAAKSLLELKAFLKKHGLGDIIKTLDLNAERRALTNESPNSM